MPRKADNQAAVETEKGFGTGLRVKLEGRNPAAPTSSAVEEPPTDADASAEVEAHAVATPAEIPPELELSETEQLWAELEESLAREETLRRALDEQRETFERAADLERRLGRRAQALDQRERKLEERVQALEKERTHDEERLQALETERTPDEERRESEPHAAPNEVAHAYLQRRAEEHVEQVWRVFQESLTATKPNGQPDFRTRLLAAKALLAEAYRETEEMTPGEQVAAARDEVAGMRARKAQKPLG